MSRLIPSEANVVPSTRAYVLTHAPSADTTVTNVLTPMPSRALCFYSFMLSHHSATTASSWHIVISGNGAAAGTTTTGLILCNAYIGNAASGTPPLIVNYGEYPFILDQGMPLGYWVESGAAHGGANDSEIILMVRYSEIYGSK